MEAGLVDSGQGLLPEAMVVGRLELGWCGVAAGRVQAAVVVEVDPLEGGELKVVETLPGAAAAAGGSLVPRVDRRSLRTTTDAAYPQSAVT